MDAGEAAWQHHAMPADPRPVVRHVLFDADDVLQQAPQTPQEMARPHLGDRAADFIRAAFTDERPTLAGQGDLLSLLAALLVEYGVTTDVEQVFADIWLQVTVSQESLALVGQLRGSGYGVHLGTNQDRYRGRWMRDDLSYGDLFDVECWSYELGHAKPSPDFFTAAACRIGAAPETILFIDDRQDNVTAARGTGMPAIRWDLSQPHELLVRQLVEHGVDPQVAIT